VKIECDEELFMDAFKDAFEEYFQSGKFDPPYIFYETLAPSFTKIMQKVVEDDNRPEWITEIMRMGILNLQNFIMENEIVDRISYLEDRIEKLEKAKS
jgi:hypothetical protein